MIGHALRTAHLLKRLHQLVPRDAEVFQQFRRGNIGAGEREQVMLSTRILVLQLRHLLFRAIQHATQFVRQSQIDSRAVHLRTAIELRTQAVTQLIRVDSNFFEQRPCYSVGLIKESRKKMLVRDFLVIELRSEILRRLQRFLHFLREFVHAHKPR